VAWELSEQPKTIVVACAYACACSNRLRPDIPTAVAMTRGRQNGKMAEGETAI
jgi:hypothetical protein